MPSYRLTVSVPQLCHEDWSAMTPQNQGRFCQSCFKTVVDFTSMSDAEIMAWLSKQQSSTCGRFKEKQLGRELVAVSASRNRWPWKAATLGLAAWLSAKTVEAKNSITTPVFIRTAERENAPKNLSLQDSLSILKGRVLDSQDQTPIPGVTIQIKGTTTFTSTNVDGYFSLTVPANLSLEKPVVLFSFIGYVPQEKDLVRLLKSPEELVLLTLDTQALGEMVLVGGYHVKWYAPHNLFQRFKNLFRN